MKLDNYKKIFSLSLFVACFSLFIGGIQAQNVVWGDNPGEGDFDGGLNGWTTQGLSQDSHVWTWESDGIIDTIQCGGSVFTPFQADTIFSETRENGAAVFEGEKNIRRDNDCNIPPNNGGYGEHFSELISPEIDLSGTGAIILEFTSLLAELNAYPDFTVATNAGFSYRVDGGEWTDPVYMPDIEPNGPLETKVNRFYLAEAAGAETFQVKFIYHQDFYYWMIDDVKIIDDPVSSDVAITDVFYTPGVYAQPSYVIPYDTMFWQFDIGQAFARPAENLSASLSVTRDSDGEVLYQDSKSLATLPPASSRTDSFETVWGPPMDMEPGFYTVTYEVNDPDLEADEVNLDNNTFSYKFEVTENTFRTDNGLIQDYIPSRTTDIVWVGNLYRWPAEIQGTYYVDSIETAYATEEIGTDVTDHVFSLLFNRVSDDILPDFSNYMVDAETPDRDGEQQTVLGLNTIFIEEYEPETIEAFSLKKPTNPNEDLSEEERELQPGSRYFVWVGLPDANTNPGSGVACSVRPADPDVELNSFVPGLHIGQYFFGGFTGSRRAPVLRMNITTDPNAADEPRLDPNVLSAFPNPASSTINAELNFDEPTDLTLVILDMTGKVFKISTHQGVTNTTVQKNISNLASGTYIMRVVTDNGVRNQKFIKQ